MNNNSKDFSYTVGIFDVICRQIRKKIEEESTKDGPYGIGVYTDEFCEEELMTKPMKKFDERAEIAKCFKDVDFVFSVSDRDPKKVQEVAENAYRAYMEENKKREEAKKYKVGFVIGSFDVFHAGHLENLTLAKEMCEKLVVVLKTDERIQKNKNKKPRQSTAERAEVLRFMKIIDQILYMDIDTTRQDIISDVIGLYKDVEPKDIVAVFGSDLQEKEAKYIPTDWSEINVVFTNREPEKMKIVSSSHYQKECDAHGGIKSLEEIEEKNLR